MVENLHFQKIYKELNNSQKKAVDTIDGPVLVVAGPGTGKTQVLAARVANILQKTDTAPQNILALTFTESAAKNMRDRVVQMIGRAGFYVEITTFHSFCTSVINSHPEFFPIERTSQPISDVERFGLVREIITELPLEALKPISSPYFYVQEVIRALSELKREGVTVEDFATLVNQSFLENSRPEKKGEQLQFDKQKQKNEELVAVYGRYQLKLRERAKYDFDDMVSLVVDAFRREESLLSDYQERYHYFLVDEYQDTNTAQNEVVYQLAAFWGEAANIFVVGDPHQSIYRFQGASTENVVDFIEKYPAATVITLDTSYRCPQELQDLARQLIGHNTTRLGEQANSVGAKLEEALAKPLHATKQRSDAVEVWSAPSQTVELIQVAEKIKKLLAEGVKPEEIAVLYRTNKEVVELSEVLEKWDILYEIDGGSNVFEFEPVRQLLQLLRVVAAVQAAEENEVLFEVLCYSWLQHDVLSVYQLSRLASSSKLSLRKFLQLGFTEVNENFPDVFAEGHFTNLAQFMHKLERWVVLDAQMGLPAWFELILQESGFSLWLQKQSNVTEILLYIHTLCDFIKKLSRSIPNCKLANLLAAVETMQTYHIPLIVQDFNISEGAVHLSTVHRAKGREWQYVFVVHCIDGVWGNGRERNLLPLPAGLLHHTDNNKKEKNEDDRRLLYVALTRAKEQCLISYPESLVVESKSRAVSASMFLYELQEGQVSLVTQKNEQVVAKQEEYLLRLVSPTSAAHHDARTEAFFKQLVSGFKLSATALNNYLHDPQRFILQNLLTIPQTKEVHLAFGTAIHAAMEEVFRQVISEKKVTDKQAIFEKYEKILKEETPFSDDLDRRITYGRTVLTNYIDNLDQLAVKPWQVERSFGRGHSVVTLDDINLTGRIDRFDWIDETKKLVQIVDYKTGTAKSRNTILGKTVAAELSTREAALPESIRGKYKRQLLFYKLLTDLDRSFTPKVVSGCFEFLEPDKKTGKITQHQFDLPETEVKELQELIRTVMQEIRSLTFLDLLPSLTSNLE